MAPSVPSYLGTFQARAILAVASAAFIVLGGGKDKQEEGRVMLS
jgi:hypothetical protein